MKDAAPSSASPVHGLQKKDSKENELRNEIGESKRAEVVDADNQQQGDEDDDGNDLLLPEGRSWLDPTASGPAGDDEINGKDSHHARLTSMWAHPKQGHSQIISQASGVSDPRGGKQQRRKGSSRSPDGGATTASPVAQALKRVSIELPLELSRVDSSTDGASGSPSSAMSIPYRISGGSKSRRIDFSTSAPVSRTVTASMHCQAGLKGTRTGYSNANVEIRYKPTPARRNGSDATNHTSGILTRRSDATYTASLALTERPSLSVGATHVLTSLRRERSTTWSWKVASPKLNPATMTTSHVSSWWKGMAGRLGWSRDVSSFCTVRSTLALALPPKDDDSRRAPTSSRQNRAGAASPTTAHSTPLQQMPGAILYRFGQSFSSASVTLASRNTLHKWSASLSWNLLNFPTVRRRVDAAQDDGKKDQQTVPLQTLSWKPRIALSVSPDLPRALAARSCRVSGWYSVADSSWSIATSMSKAVRGTHVSLGWTKASSGSWTYLITVSLGTMATIRIPVTVTAVLDPFWYPVQVGFTSIASGLIQEAVSHALALPSSASHRGTGLGGGSSNEESDALASSRRQRARKLAENQQSLMRRTAENRMRAERAKSNEQQRQQQGGLVIDRAVYYTDRESWDVTIPLQFWVQDSLLDIGPATKKDLLGFYDLSYRAEPAKPRKDEPAKSWISGFWTPRGDKAGSNGDLGGGNGGGGSRHRSATRQLVTPQLKIEYTFNGQPHQAIFQDHDEILLPREAFVN
jgi:Domain of unknown function (DUF3395)